MTKPIAASANVNHVSPSLLDMVGEVAAFHTINRLINKAKTEKEPPMAKNGSKGKSADLELAGLGGGCISWPLLYIDGSSALASGKANGAIGLTVVGAKAAGPI